MFNIFSSFIQVSSEFDEYQLYHGLLPCRGLVKFGFVDYLAVDLQSVISLIAC